MTKELDGEITKQDVRLLRILEDIVGDYNENEIENRTIKIEDALEIALKAHNKYITFFNRNKRKQKLLHVDYSEVIDDLYFY